MPNRYHYKTLVQSELRDFSATLHGLDKEDWEHPSLCEGWKVRHVVGHLVAGYSIPVSKALWDLATQYRFNFPKGVHETSTRYGDENSPEKLLALFDQWTQRGKHIGVASLPPMSEHFLDHMIHHWDVTMPLGRPRQASEERLTAALETMVKALGVTGLRAGKKTSQGLRLKATDVNWQHGDGPEVAGEAPYIILALSGRPIGLEKLQGEGVSTLRSRIGAGG